VIIELLYFIVNINERIILCKASFALYLCIEL
jgi:hypothetical protein